jgi:hypothetical protein
MTFYLVKCWGEAARPEDLDMWLTADRLEPRLLPEWESRKAARKTKTKRIVEAN